MAGLEIRMRRTFLMHDSATRPFVAHLRRKDLASYPLNHPKGLVLYMCFVMYTVAACMQAWFVFVALVICP